MAGKRIYKRFQKGSPEFREFLISEVEYIPETGSLKKHGSKNQAGVQVINGKKCKVRVVLHDKMRYSPEKIAWCIQTGEWPPKYMGYKNGNDLDWRFENLFIIGNDQHE